MRDQENYTRPFSNYIDVVPYKEDLALYNKINGFCKAIFNAEL